MTNETTPPENICLSPAQATTPTLEHAIKHASLHLGHSPTKTVIRYV